MHPYEYFTKIRDCQSGGTVLSTLRHDHRQIYHLWA